MRVGVWRMVLRAEGTTEAGGSQVTRGPAGRGEASGLSRERPVEGVEQERDVI